MRCLTEYSVRDRKNCSLISVVFHPLVKRTSCLKIKLKPKEVRHMFSLAIREEVIGRPSDYASGLSLIIPESIESAALPIGWCVTPDVVERLRAEKDAGDLCLLISVGTFSQDSCRPDKRLLQERYRRLVPLEQGKEYVDLFFEGGTYIAASIVVGERSKLREEYLSWGNSANPHMRTDYTTYENQLIEGSFLVGGEDKFWKNAFYRSRSYEIGASFVFFEVPSGVFAKKPWDYGWLTLFLGTPRDQCSLRVRRRLFSYTLQPLFFLFLLVLFSVWVCVRCSFLGALWIFGFWKASRSHLFDFDDPMNLSLRPRHCGENVYWKAFSKVGHLLVSRVPSLQRLESKYSAWCRRRNDEKLGKANALQEVKRARREELFDSACDILHTKLTCAANPHSEVVIRPGRKTFALRYQSLKAQVCRPFSQGK